MNPKITYLRGQISGLNAQLAADNGKSNILGLLQKANALLNAREELGEEVNRANTEALLTQVVAAVDAYNAANQVTIDTVENIMAGFDAAVEASDEPAPADA